MTNTSNTLTVWLQLSKDAKYNDIEVNDYTTSPPTQIDLDYLGNRERYVKVSIEFPEGYFEPKDVHEVKFVASSIPEDAPRAVNPDVDRHSAFD